MKVCFVLRSLGTGGTERQAALLARGLCDRGWSVRVVTFYGGGEFEADLAGSGVDVVTVEKRGRWDLIGFAWRLYGAARAFGADVVYGFLAGPNVAAFAVASVQRPRPAVVWGIRGSQRPLEGYDWVERTARRFQRYLAKGVALTIANSEAGRRYCIGQGFPSQRVEVVRNGIDTGRFARDLEGRRLTRVAWDVGEGDVLIGLVARIEPVKGHRLFLEVAAQMVDRFDDVRFVCVGTGVEAQERCVRTIASDLNLGSRLIWAGHRSDMPSVLSAIDVIVSASDSEGFSNVIVEGMACGAFPVVTDVGDSASIVGDHGIVVPPGDASEMVDALIRARSVVSGDRDCVARASSEGVGERYGVDRMIDSTAHLLERLR